MGGYEDSSLIFFFLAKLEGKEREQRGSLQRGGNIRVNMVTTWLCFWWGTGRQCFPNGLHAPLGSEQSLLLFFASPPITTWRES